MMNILARKRPLNHCLLFVFALFFVYSCGGGSSDSSSTGESAALFFDLQFQRSTDRASNDVMPRAVDPNVCNDYLIESVLVEVYRSSDNVVVASAERTCGAHGLTITNLPAGVNLYVVCKGFVGQQINWQGQIIDISLFSGEARDIGTIIMGYVGDDQSSPQVVSVYPADGAVEVDLNISITVGFDEPLAPSSISDDAIVVMDNGTAIAGTVSYDSVTDSVRFTPEGLSTSTTYTFTLRATADNHVTDTAGLALVGDFSWQFTTTSGIVDTTPPQIISVAPTSNNASLDVTVQATFNESMDPDSLDETVFTLSSTQGAVDATVAYFDDSYTAILTPNASLTKTTEYTATISTDAQDVSGNALAEPYSWTFTTLTPPPCSTLEVSGFDVQDIVNGTYTRSNDVTNEQPVWESNTHTIEFGVISSNYWEILLKQGGTGAARPALCDTGGDPGGGPFSCSNWREWRGSSLGFVAVPANFVCFDD